MWAGISIFYEHFAQTCANMTEQHTDRKADGGKYTYRYTRAGSGKGDRRTDRIGRHEDEERWTEWTEQKDAQIRKKHADR